MLSSDIWNHSKWFSKNCICIHSNKSLWSLFNKPNDVHVLLIYCYLFIQSKLYLKDIQENMKMRPLWAVVLYSKISCVPKRFNSVNIYIIMLCYDINDAKILVEVTDIVLHPVAWWIHNLKTLVVTGTDCIACCKSKYHTITTTTATFIFVVL
jgi:hypothetical protein